MSQGKEQTNDPRAATNPVAEFVFVTAFLVVAAILAFQTLSELRDWWQARNWVETPCWIEHLDIEKEERAKGGNIWTSRAVYRFTYGGRERRNCTIDLHQKNRHRIAIGEKHQLLRTYQGSDTPFRCFVNPVSPEQVTLFRDLRTGELLVHAAISTVLFAVGAWFFASRVRDFRRRRALERGQKDHPDEPWRWRSEWQGAAIQPVASNTLWLSLAGAWGLVVLGALMAAVWLNDSLRRDWLVSLAMLPLVVLGLELVRRAAGCWQMGFPRLTLNEWPLRRGGVIEGVLKLGPGKRRLMLRLVCESWSRSGEAINARRMGESVAFVEADGEATVRMQLPQTWPGSTPEVMFVPSRQEAWRWALLVSSNRWMKPFRLPLPVFDTAK